MSRSDTADRRFRVFCDACDWHADADHLNSLVARAEAERHDERNHDGEETADVEVVTETAEPEIVTDGGFETVDEIAPEDDRPDPENLPRTYTPAVVKTAERGPAFVANYNTLSSGWLALQQWDGERKKLPPNRVLSVSDVTVEPVRDAEQSHRVADGGLREEARAVYPDQVDGAPRRDDEIDRGEAVVPDGGGDA